MTGLSNSSWPKFKRDIKGTGQGLASETDGTVKWSINIGVYSSQQTGTSVSIGQDGTIYSTVNGSLKAVNPDDGTIKWTYSTIYTSIDTPSIDSDGVIYFNETNPDTYAIYPDGTLKWGINPFGLRPASGSSNIANDGTIYIPLANSVYYLYSGFLALNPDGSQKWIFEPDIYGQPFFGTPAIADDGTIYIGRRNGRFYAINPNGYQQWVYNTGNIIYSSPAIADDGTIYVTSRAGGNSLYAFNPNGSLKWSFVIGGNDAITSPSIDPDGTLYVGGSGLHAINPNGSLKWFFASGNTQSTPSISSNGVIYFGNEAGTMYAIDSNGNQIWNYNTGSKIRGSPAIDSKGNVYVFSHYSTLWAFASLSSTCIIKRDEGIYSKDRYCYVGEGIIGKE